MGPRCLLPWPTSQVSLLSTRALRSCGELVLILRHDTAAGVRTGGLMLHVPAKARRRQAGRPPCCQQQAITAMSRWAWAVQDASSCLARSAPCRCHAPSCSLGPWSAKACSSAELQVSRSRRPLHKACRVSDQRACTRLRLLLVPRMLPDPKRSTG